MEITRAYVKSILPHRDPEGHKGTFGKVYCLCGAVGYTGAPVLAASAAVRSGSGLVFLGVPKDIWPIVAVKCDSAMPSPLPSQQGKLALAAEDAVRAQIDGCDAVLIGCGMGRSEESDALTRRLIDMDKPLVLDADGINAFETHIPEIKRRQGKVTEMTPHEGEFFRAGGDLSRGRESGAQACGPLGRVSDPEGPPHHCGRPGWPSGSEHHRQQRHGEGRQRRHSLRHGGEPAGTGDGTVRRLLRRRVLPRPGGRHGRGGAGRAGHVPGRPALSPALRVQRDRTGIRKAFRIKLSEGTP